MLKKLLYFTVLIINLSEINSQTISGKIINQNSLDPIEKAAILTNIKSGTISDKYGNYTLNLKDVKTITFSCLGFQSRTITKNQLIKNNYVVNLIENVNLLNEFQLNIAKITLDSLLIKTSHTMKENYLSSTIKQEFYTIENQKLDFKKLDFELNSSSLLSRKKRKLAEEDLKTFSDDLQKRKPSFGSEFKATILSSKLYSEKLKKDIDSYQVEAIQGFKKIAIGNGITVENITKKLQNIVLKHLSSKNTYKVKSGLFKVEDSLSLAETSKIADSLAKVNTFNNYNQNYSIRRSKKIGTFFNDSSERNFLDQKYYEHQLEENEILGSKKYYVISFTPDKSKSKYAGKIYVDPSDFIIKKIAYSYAEGKRGEHLNLKFLFGIKFSENTHEVTLYYEKDKDGKVYTSYLNQTNTNYAYIDRPIKFIENSKERNKIKFNIKVEINVTDNSEIFLKTPNYIDANKIKKQTKEEIKKRTEYMTKIAYENTDWKNRILINEYLAKYN
jgi:hypothetical protein